MALNLGCIKLGHRWNAIVVVSGKGYAAVLKKFVSLSALLKFPFSFKGTQPFSSITGAAM